MADRFLDCFPVVLHPCHWHPCLRAGKHSGTKEKKYDAGCLWTAKRFFKYMQEMDSWRQLCFYNPACGLDQDPGGGNVYRLLAIVGPQWGNNQWRGVRDSGSSRYGNDPKMPTVGWDRSLGGLKFSQPNIVAYIILIFMGASIALMQFVIPWTLVHGFHWPDDHVMGVKRMIYYWKHLEDVTLVFIPLFFVATKFLVTVEKAVRDELNQCSFLYRCVYHNKIQYGFPGSHVCSNYPQKAWSFFWITLSLATNLWVAALMTMYVIHSIATYQAEGSGTGGFMSFILDVIGSLGMMTFDDEIMSSLPLWSRWWKEHTALIHPQGEHWNGDGSGKNETGIWVDDAEAIRDGFGAEETKARDEPLNEFDRCMWLDFKIPPLVDGLSRLRPTDKPSISFDKAQFDDASGGEGIIYPGSVVRVKPGKEGRGFDEGDEHYEHGQRGKVVSIDPGDGSAMITFKTEDGELGWKDAVKISKEHLRTSFTVLPHPALPPVQLGCCKGAAKVSATPIFGFVVNTDGTVLDVSVQKHSICGGYVGWLKTAYYTRDENDQELHKPVLRPLEVGDTILGIVGPIDRPRSEYRWDLNKDKKEMTESAPGFTVEPSDGVTFLGGKPSADYPSRSERERNYRGARWHRRAAQENRGCRELVRHAREHQVDCTA